MSHDTGTASGIVWNYLNENGPTTAGRMSKDTGLEKKIIQRAVGWLEKEDKVTIQLSDEDKDLISLKDSVEIEI